MKSTLTCLCLVLVMFAAAQHNSCLQNYLYPINSNNAVVADLDFMRSILMDVDMVALGEEEHGAGTTLETKTDIVKYLHQKMGYNVLAFESGMYECVKAWQMIEAGANADTTVPRATYGVWSNSKQMQALFKYIQEQKELGTPLILTGFDLQFSGPSSTASISEDYLVADLSYIVGKYDVALLSRPWWSTFATDMQSLTAYGSADSVCVAEYLDTVKASLSRLPLNSELAFWLQWINSTRHYLLDNAHRDKYMAENMIWLKKNMYANEKVILWGASLHFAYSFDCLVNRNDRKYIQQEYSIPMGYYMKQEYGDKLFTIGSIFAKGELAWPWEKTPRHYNHLVLGSLERKLNKVCSQAHALLDLSKMPESCGYKSKTASASPFGWRAKLRLPLAFDALMFHKSMERNNLWIFGNN